MPRNFSCSLDTTTYIYAIDIFWSMSLSLLDTTSQRNKYYHNAMFSLTVQNRDERRSCTMSLRVVLNIVPMTSASCEGL